MEKVFQVPYLVESGEVPDDQGFGGMVVEAVKNGVITVMGTPLASTIDEAVARGTFSNSPEFELKPMTIEDVREGVRRLQDGSEPNPRWTKALQERYVALQEAHLAKATPWRPDKAPEVGKLGRGIQRGWGCRLIAIASGVG